MKKGLLFLFLLVLFPSVTFALEVDGEITCDNVTLKSGESTNCQVNLKVSDGSVVGFDGTLTGEKVSFKLASNQNSKMTCELNNSDISCAATEELTDSINVVNLVVTADNIEEDVKATFGIEDGLAVSSDGKTSKLVSFADMNLDIKNTLIDDTDKTDDTTNEDKDNPETGVSLMVALPTLSILLIGYILINKYTKNKKRFVI